MQPFERESIALPIPYSDSLEVIPADEAENIQRIVASVKKLLVNDFEKSGQFHSDVHVKTHGYANGELTVMPDLPYELAQGLFSLAKSYPAIVRFSNSANQSMPDAVPDGRGLAIQIKSIAGDFCETDSKTEPTQDFILINHPVFFAADAKRFLRLEKVLEESSAHKLSARKALTGDSWNPLNWHWHEMLTAAEIAAKVPTHPTNTTYYSMSPFRFGQYVAKFRVQPIENTHDSYLKLLERLGSQPDALRLALEETLRSGSVRFHFQVQLRNSESMPIEDATTLWSEDDSPFRTVAHLTFPQQEISALRNDSQYKNLAFNVWHALTDHRPLGGINRVRRVVYPVSAAWRRGECRSL